MSVLHLSRATTICDVDCSQFGPSKIFGLKIELTACAGLVGGTTDKICIFPDLIYKYQLYEIIMNCIHHTSAVPQPILLLIAAKLVLAEFLG